MLDDLDSEHLLSDERFTEAYVRHRAAAGYGPLRIQRELQQRGVDAALIASGLEVYAGEWPERAAAARHKRFGDHRPEGFRERARQARFLEYRGFTAEHIRAALSED